MLLKSEVMRFLRARLRDEKEPYAFSDDLLFQALQSAQNQILNSFNLAISHFSKEFCYQREGDELFSLPVSALKIINVFLNGKPLVRVGFSYAIERYKSVNAPLFYSLSAQNFGIYPKEALNGLLEVFFIPMQKIDEHTQEFLCDEAFLDLLCIGALKNLCTIESHSSNLQRVEFYAKLYNGELDRCFKLYSSINARPCVESMYKKV